MWRWICTRARPGKSVTIKLAPANVRKEGAGFDLPMAMGILGVMGMVRNTDQHVFLGELSLDGSLRPVRGALSIAACARRIGLTHLLVPADNAAEAAMAEGISVYAIRHLAEAVRLVNQPDRSRRWPEGERLRRPRPPINWTSGRSAGRPRPSGRCRWPLRAGTTC